jgi:outer membrane lipoprotein-sorting protein
MKRWLCLAAVVQYASFCFAQLPETKMLVNNMLQAIKSAKSYTYTMKGSERIIGKNEMRVTEVFTKINVNPKKIFARVVSEPNKGTEMLFVTGERENKILVKAGWVPSLKLSPFSSLLMKEQHHCLLSSGFDFFYKNISEGVKRAEAKNQFDRVFKIEGEVTYDGRKCYKLVIEDPTYDTIEYVGTKGDNAYNLSQKLLIPEYFIMEANGIKNIDDNLEGKKLKVVTSYAKKSIVYVDKQNFFPIYQEMWDSKGMFEKYEFKNLVVNPPFAENEFSSDFSDYNF